MSGAAEFVVVFAELAHLSAIREILAFYVENSCVTFRAEAPSLVELTEKFEKRGNLPWLVLLGPDRDVAGFAYCSKFRESAGWSPTAEISLYLRHTHCGKGLGKALLERVIAESRSLSLEVLLSLISVDAAGLGAASVNLHKRMGFVQSGLIKNCGFKMGKKLDCVFMSLALQ